METSSKQPYPGLNALIVTGLLGVIVGVLVLGVTVVRSSTHLWPLVAEKGAYITTGEMSNVFTTWTGAAVTLLGVGLVVAAGAIVARLKTAGRFTGKEPGKLWVGVVGPVSLWLLGAGTIALPVAVEAETRVEVRHNTEVAEAARERSVELTKQRQTEYERSRATPVEQAIDALASNDESVRQEAIRRLQGTFELAIPNPPEPFAAPRARLLNTLNDHWREICTSDQIASDLGHLYSRLDAVKGAAFFKQWHTERMKYLDPHSEDFKRSLRANEDPENLEMLRAYCERIGKGAVASDKTLAGLYEQAVNQSLPQVVNLLLEEGIPVDTPLDGRNNTAVCLECERGAKGPSLETLKILLAHGRVPMCPTLEAPRWFK